jgi:hypothetical protein
LDTASSYRIILDTNFLLIPFQFKVDIFPELERAIKGSYKVYVTDGVIRELKSLDQRIARAARELASRLPVIETGEDGMKNVDTALLKLALEKNTIICTNDKILIEKLRSKGLPVIYLRQKKYLVLEGYLE